MRIDLRTGLLLLLLSLPYPLRGDLHTWNAGDGLWNVPGNWLPEGVPDNGDSAVVNGNVTVTVAGSPALGSLSVGAGATVLVPVAGTLEISGPSLHNSGIIEIEDGAQLRIAQAGTGIVQYTGSGNIVFHESSAITRLQNPVLAVSGAGTVLRLSGSDGTSPDADVHPEIRNSVPISLARRLNVNLRNVEQQPGGVVRSESGSLIKLAGDIAGGAIETRTRVEIQTSLVLRDVTHQGPLLANIPGALRLKRSSADPPAQPIDLALMGGGDLLIDGTVAVVGLVNTLGPELDAIRPFGTSDRLVIGDSGLEVTGKKLLIAPAVEIREGSILSFATSDQSTVKDVESAGTLEIISSTSLLTQSTTTQEATGEIVVGGELEMRSSLIQGGLLNTIPSGRILARGGKLLDVRLQGALIEIENGQSLDLDGRISGDGEFRLLSEGATTRLTGDVSAELDGLFVLRLTQSELNEVTGLQIKLLSSIALSHFVQPIKAGAPSGRPSVTLVNHGRVTVAGDFATRILGTNEGEICVSGGATAAIGVSGAGRIAVDPTDSGIEIMGITGGVLAEGTCGGTAKVPSRGTAPATGFVARGYSSLNGVTSRATILVPDGETLRLSKSFRNAGAVRLAGDAVGSRLTIVPVTGQPFTLDGGGVIDLGDSPNNNLNGDNSSAVLVNVDNTIRGGALVNNTTCFGGFNIKNRGTIRAEGTSTLSFGDCATLSNEGHLEVTAGASLYARRDILNYGETVVAGGGLLSGDQRIDNFGYLTVAPSAALDVAELEISAGSADVRGTFHGFLDIQDGGISLAGTLDDFVSNGGGNLQIGPGIATLQVDATFSHTHGVLEIDLGGPSHHDIVRTTPTFFNATRLGGTVFVRAVGGFEPLPGQEFTFFEYGYRTGEFVSAFNATPYPLTWELVYGGLLNDTVTLRAHAAAPGPDLALTMKDLADPIAPGALQAYRLTVANEGPFPATGVVVEHELPGATTFVSAQASAGSCSHAGGLVTCNLGTLGVGSSREVTVETTVDAAFLGFLYSSASAFAVETDPIPVDNLAAEDSLVVGPLFDDGFESGDTLAWSASEP